MVAQKQPQHIEALQRQPVIARRHTRQYTAHQPEHDLCVENIAQLEGKAAEIAVQRAILPDGRLFGGIQDQIRIRIPRGSQLHRKNEGDSKQKDYRHHHQFRPPQGKGPTVPVQQVQRGDEDKQHQGVEKNVVSIKFYQFSCRIVGADIAGLQTGKHGQEQHEGEAQHQHHRRAETG